MSGSNLKLLCLSMATELQSGDRVQGGGSETMQWLRVGSKSILTVTRTRRFVKHGDQRTEAARRAKAVDASSCRLLWEVSEFFFYDLCI